MICLPNEIIDCFTVYVKFLEFNYLRFKFLKFNLRHLMMTSKLLKYRVCPNPEFCLTNYLINGSNNKKVNIVNKMGR